MSLISRFALRARENPKKIALLTEKSQMTYEDILHLVHLLDVQFTTRGLRPEQTVVMASRRPEFCIALALLLSLRKLTVVFSTAESAVAAGLAFDRVVTTDPVPGMAMDRQIVIEEDWFSILGTLPLPDYGAEPGGGVFVYSSSGTTGTPKFIRSTEAERLAQGDGQAFWGLVDLSSRRVLSTLTCYSGWSMALLLETLLAGGSAVALTQGSANVLPWIDLYHVDTLGTSPAVLQMILEQPQPGQYLAGLRDIRVGGAQAGAKLLEAFAKVCPARVHLGYGSAELGPCFRWVHDPTTPRPDNYLGEFRRTDLKIGLFDADLNHLPDATEGIVGFRPAAGGFTRQYLAEDDDTSSGFIKGWFFPGDILRREGDSYFILGRTKDIVNFGGNKFSLAHVRQVLSAAFPGARIEPVVLADADGLERLGLAYLADRMLADVEIMAALAPFTGLKVLRSLRLDELPLTDSGKVDVARLRRMFLQS